MWPSAQLAASAPLAAADIARPAAAAAGYSRDDIGTFLPTYLSTGIRQSDPFQARARPPRLDGGGLGRGQADG